MKTDSVVPETICCEVVLKASYNTEKNDQLTALKNPQAVSSGPVPY